ncbi:hypothetical protein AMTR_s00032p00177510 [Amborella trichopoda]|uniref:PGG domain-containing protein n=1 Tax=Amborella trichopoda TaxID=13333 RepID=U5CY45_AMBTC|nr:hypothetical protein AMTR_s00032p00177510 [Amborella trichopoda]
MTPSQETIRLLTSRSSPRRRLESVRIRDLEVHKSVIIELSVLTANITFQAGLNAYSNLGHDTSSSGSKRLLVNYYQLNHLFIVCNTVFIPWLLTTVRCKLLMRVMEGVTWLSISFIAMSVFIGISVLIKT